MEQDSQNASLVTKKLLKFQIYCQQQIIQQKGSKPFQTKSSKYCVDCVKNISQNQSSKYCVDCVKNISQNQSQNSSALQQILQSKKGYGNCQQKGHQQRKIILFCIEERCILENQNQNKQKNIRCCAICYKQKHKNHRYLTWDKDQRQILGQQFKDVKRQIKNNFVTNQDAVQRLSFKAIQQVYQNDCRLFADQLYQYVKKYQTKKRIHQLESIKTLHEKQFWRQFFEHFNQLSENLIHQALTQIKDKFIYGLNSGIQLIKNQVQKPLTEKQIHPYYKCMPSQKWRVYLQTFSTLLNQETINKSDQISSKNYDINFQYQAEQYNMAENDKPKQQDTQLIKIKQKIQLNIENGIKKIISFLELSIEKLILIPNMIYQIAKQLSKQDTEKQLQKCCCNNEKATELAQKVILLKTFQAQNLVQKSFEKFTQEVLSVMLPIVRNYLKEKILFVKNLCQDIVPVDQKKHQLLIELEDILIKKRIVRLHLAHFTSKRLYKKIVCAIIEKQIRIEEIIIQNQYFKNIFKIVSQQNKKPKIKKQKYREPYPQNIFLINNLKKFSFSYRVKFELPELKRLFETYENQFKKIQQFRVQGNIDDIKIKGTYLQPTKVMKLFTKSDYNVKYFSCIFDQSKFYRNLFQLFLFSNRTNFQTFRFELKDLKEVMFPPALEYMNIGPIQHPLFISYFQYHLQNLKKQITRIDFGSFSQRQKITKQLSKSLMNLKKIQTLNLKNIQNFYQQQQLIYNLPNLKVLILYCTNVTQKILKKLQQNDKLSRLFIHYSKTTDFNLTSKAFKQLAFYNVSGIQEQGAICISKLINVELLNIGNDYRNQIKQDWVTDKLIKQISNNLSKLRFLNIENTCVTNEGAKKLKSLQRLETLICGHNQIDITVINFITQSMRRLRKLSIAALKLDTKFSDEQIKQKFQSFGEALARILKNPIPKFKNQQMSQEKIQQIIRPLTHLDIQFCDKISAACLNSETLRCLKINRAYFSEKQLSKKHKYYSIAFQTGYFLAIEQ